MEEDKDIQALVDWMHSHPYADKFKHDKVTIAKVPFLGRGIVATEDIEEGEVFVEVPFIFILTIENSNVKNSVELLNAVKSHPIRDYKELMGAILLLIEMDNPDSFWLPYIRTFPKHVPMPDSWTEEEVEFLEEKSMFRDLIQYSKDTIANKYIAIVKPFMEEHPELFNRVYTFEEYRHALSISNSRSFDFGDICGQHAVIPYIDFINHCSDNGGSTKKNKPASYFYEHNPDDPKVEECIFKVVAHQNYKAGDQIFITYGERSNAQFLLSYGFCFPDNEADVLEISNIDLPVQQSKEPKQDPPSRVRKLKDILLADMCFSLQIDYEDNRPYSPITLLNLIRLCYMSPKERADLYFVPPTKKIQNQRNPKKKGKKGRKNNNNNKKQDDVHIDPMNEHLPVRASIDARANQYLIDVLERRLASYRTTIEEDEKELQRTDLSYNAQKAVMFRKEEKRLLRKYIDLFKLELSF